MATYMRVGEALELTGLWVQDLPRLTALVKPWDSQSQQDQTLDGTKVSVINTNDTWIP